MSVLEGKVLSLCRNASLGASIPKGFCLFVQNLHNYWRSVFVLPWSSQEGYEYTASIKVSPYVNLGRDLR